MDLGIIGNCNYSALIDREANVSFMCWPRFDSDFVFSSLLDKERGGYFRIGPAGPAQSTQEYLVNSNILKTTFRTNSGSFEVLDFAPRYRRNDRYFKPVTLIRIVRILSGEPNICVAIKPIHDYGRSTMKAAVSSNHIRFDGGELTLRLYTNASLNIILEGRPFPAEETLYFALTCNNSIDAPLRETCEEHFIGTLAYWQRWIKHCVLPRKYQDQVIRSALTLKMHQFEDTGAVIAATTTSIPEADGTVRNWDYRYCWLRDAQMVVWALHTLSHFEELDEFIRFLKFITQNAADELQPVYGISGEKKLHELTLDHLAGYRGNPPVRIGNDAYRQIQHDVYGGLLVAISPHYLDVRFRQHDSSISTRLVHQLMDKIEKYLVAPDAGIWEYRAESRVHTYTLLQHWKGAVKAMEIGQAFGDDRLYNRARKVAQTADSLMRERTWHDQQTFFAQSTESDQADASLLMMVNLGFLTKDDLRALQHVESTSRVLKTKTEFLKRYIHKDDFGDTHNAFIICSFWLVEALARLGQKEKAEALMDKLIGIANHLGLYSEDYDPEKGELWGNFPQTYSHVGLIRAAFALSPPWFE